MAPILHEDHCEEEADRQQVAPDTRTALLWLSSSALAGLVGLAEVYSDLWPA